ncbi:hypothetical protein [Tautonia sociabilis]|uniref:Uncharacterized protein n=1 Tax=Tautonia sociabilis TaxID=2080755 RepID=A0A432MDA9_9BACT|nr:hypothetical protein [Tautonia sociabilis]RUL81762.1 hypothetical protein TsocGM_24515 [Tautonia sociabilis]
MLALLVSAALLAHAIPAHANITISFTNPIANSNFAVGSPIPFGGGIVLSAPERITSRVQVDLVHSSTSNPPPGTGTILDRTDAALEPFVFNPPPPQAWTTASTTWYHATNPSDLVASQQQGSTTGYYLRATPFWKGAFHYMTPSGWIYTTIALGQIS